MTRGKEDYNNLLNTFRLAESMRTRKNQSPDLIFESFSWCVRVMYLYAILSLFGVFFYNESWEKLLIFGGLAIVGLIVKEVIYRYFWINIDPFRLRTRLFEKKYIDYYPNEHIGIINGAVSLIFGMFKFIFYSNKRLSRIYENLDIHDDVGDYSVLQWCVYNCYGVPASSWMRFMLSFEFLHNTHWAKASKRALWMMFFGLILTYVYWWYSTH